MGQDLVIADLRPIAGEDPRILDLRLGELHGFAEPRMIRRLIKRNLPELGRHGLIVTRCNDYRNREYIEYWLNERQAIIVCMLSRAKNAEEVRRQLIEVFFSWRRTAENLLKRQVSLSPGHLRALDGMARELARRDGGTKEQRRAHFERHQYLLRKRDERLLKLGWMVGEPKGFCEE